MKKWKTPILVTGAHRSGSTFVGKALSLPFGVGYVDEPFNREYGVVGNDVWFPYVRESSDTEEHYGALVEDILSLKAKYKNPWEKSSTPLRGYINRITGGYLSLKYRSLQINPLVCQLLIKDPLACFCAEWLHNRFNMCVIVIVRHPAAFVASLRRMDWRFNINNLKKRSNLIDDCLSGVLDRNRDYSDTGAIEEAALIWNCIYAALEQYTNRNPKMIVVTHESISSEPLVAFSKLYDKLGLRFTERIQLEIEKQTGAHNPAAPNLNKAHTLKRDSRKNILRWKKLLTEDQTTIVRKITEPLSSLYYDDNDW